MKYILNKDAKHKIYIEIGETFEFFDGVETTKIKCAKAKSWDKACEGCIFHNSKECRKENFPFSCSRDERFDHNDVIFTEV